MRARKLKSWGLHLSRSLDPLISICVNLDLMILTFSPLMSVPLLEKISILAFYLSLFLFIGIKCGHCSSMAREMIMQLTNLKLKLLDSFDENCFDCLSND